MAKGWIEAKEVLIVAHYPDVKFEGHIISATDPAPISGIVLELRRCLWNTRYTSEYEQFRKLMLYPKDEHLQAIALDILPMGYESLLAVLQRRKAHNKLQSIKDHIENTLIADGVERMPGWLYDKCIEVHYINLREKGLDKASRLW